MYLQVALDTPLRRVFDYLPPAGVAASALKPGRRVSVPLGRRESVGVIVGASQESAVPADKLRRARALLDDEPLWDDTTFELLKWAASYYHHPAGEVLAAAMPSALRGGAAALRPATGWRLSDTGREALAQSPRLGKRQQELIALLGEGIVAASDVSAAGLAAALRGLAGRGWVESLELPEAPPPSAGPGCKGPTPTPAQAAAVKAINEAAPGFNAWLLHGITGSGKTEVYLQLIERCLAAGKGALVLVPEIALTPQLVSRFRERLAAPVLALHSGLSDGERFAGWRAARAGLAPVVIGTRSAVFTPMPELGLVVVDEEHDPSYKQQEGFRYSARDLAVARAQRLGIAVVMGSATPSLESLANVAAGRYRKLSLPERTGSAGKPRVALIDLRLHAAHDGLSQPALAAIERHLGEQGQVLVYLNRRGYAPTLYCTGCGWVAPCQSCDARMTVHLGRARLSCHHCGAETPMPFGCPGCGTELRPVGQGTQRVETSLEELFPGVGLVRIDRDVIRKRGDIERALGKVASGSARILLGTQMLTKGHDFPDVTLVVVLSADQGLFGADFRASERLAQQIVQVAGRAGRGDRPGEVLIQTAFPEHPLLAGLIASGYDGFAERALAERKATHWPPYSHLALLRADSPDQAGVFDFLQQAAELAPRRGRRAPAGTGGGGDGAPGWTLSRAVAAGIAQPRCPAALPHGLA